MKRHLIIGASGGIGSAVAEALQGEVTCLSRSGDGLDITDEDSIKAAFAQLSGTYDTVLVATGALSIDGYAPEKTIKTLTPEVLLGQFRTNAIGPALILKHALPFLPRDRRAVFAALSARVGSIGDNKMGGWHSYRTAKAALNQLIHGAAIELRRTHKHAICICLHPGTVETAFTAKYAAHHKTVPAQDAARNLIAVMDSLTVESTGGFFDYSGTEIPW
ncbi:SDR family NAD(P)-dependent oxidoreductase [Litoreibacter sp.]|nr:SDR family NAD(P)-dependent oxidoreductase [Litoreibacter sp.]